MDKIRFKVVNPFGRLSLSTGAPMASLSKRVDEALTQMGAQVGDEVEMRLVPKSTCGCGKVPMPAPTREGRINIQFLPPFASPNPQWETLMKEIVGPVVTQRPLAWWIVESIRDPSISVRVLARTGAEALRSDAGQSVMKLEKPLYVVARTIG